MTQPHAVAFDDQADAAETHLARILEHAAPVLLGEDNHTETPAAWLTARLDQFTAAVDTGHVALCTHLAQATAPQPAFGILGADQLTCPACAAALPDHVPCARCGAPIEQAEPAIANLGTIALLVLTCDPCTHNQH